MENMHPDIGYQTIFSNNVVVFFFFFFAGVDYERM